ncbi:SMI1/KNR4 family protein [Streptomyces justiciae]|uniref:SMI1/KNR4 family protein n=1 Tax=Streptomyces justiciae TaxID=2780140 RepID=UPI0018823C1B|nr:SMI1/KNR4 family protein [Streptomyces justiciae]MBE8474957.1 SMI1/KNR4 family protein [Streptomyces justiciae]
MADMIEDWRPFLERWSQEWADAQELDAPADERNVADEEPARARWLGFPAASEERIADLEERLGHRLPPSYRTFLAVTDGWRHAGGFVWLLAGTGQVRWHQDEAGLSESFPFESENLTPEDELLAGMWGRALQLDVESDMVYVLLDPGDVDEDGEWAVYSYASWRASPPERYPSFRAWMEDMYREFHSLQVDRSRRAGTEFVNATTRALDDSVDTARLDALAGRYEQAATALAEAGSHGRPRAGGLRDQIRRLLGETYLVSFQELATDPRYARELVPVLAAENVRMNREDRTLTARLGTLPDVDRVAVEEAVRQVGAGTYRYTPEGPFGDAVDQAREQARWGETDAAWHTLRAALPGWRPLGPDHLAPVGLYADRLLGPVITAERGRELLATPRAGHSGDTPEPTPDLDPPGLAWLTEVQPGNPLGSYRFLLVEGVEPADLPGRIGADESAVLEEPAMVWESRMRPRGGQGSAPWADEATTSVGRAGRGWSFALQAHPGASFDERWFVSPGVAASRGTRVVTVWSEPFDGQRRGVFHLSVAENGEETYAFTVRRDTTDSRGAVPGALDPHRLFPADEPRDQRLGERRALESVAAEFGVHLPRFALTQGRLHTLRTRSWRRAPGPGEGYVTVGIVGRP